MRITLTVCIRVDCCNALNMMMVNSKAILIEKGVGGRGAASQSTAN